MYLKNSTILMLNHRMLTVARSAPTTPRPKAPTSPPRAAIWVAMMIAIKTTAAVITEADTVEAIVTIIVVVIIIVGITDPALAHAHPVVTVTTVALRLVVARLALLLETATDATTPETETETETALLLPEDALARGKRVLRG